MIIRIQDVNPYVIGVSPVKFPPWNMDSHHDRRYAVYSYIDEQWAYVIGPDSIEKPHLPPTRRG